MCLTHCGPIRLIPHLKQPRRREDKITFTAWGSTLSRQLYRNTDSDSSSELPAMCDITREYIKELSVAKLQAAIHFSGCAELLEKFHKSYQNFFSFFQRPQTFYLNIPLEMVCKPLWLLKSLCCLLVFQKHILLSSEFLDFFYPNSNHPIGLWHFGLGSLSIKKYNHEVI